MRIPILTYQPMNIHGNDYGNNHLRALASDLEQLTHAGFRILPLHEIVERWLDGREAELGGRIVALACDDAADFAWEDLPHPSAGPQRSVAAILRAFNAAHPGKQPGLDVTCFEIVSPEARAVLDATCMIGKGWWSDRWWPQAASGLLQVGNHSWDHNHESLPAGMSSTPWRGTFAVVDSKELADREIARAAEYLAARAPNPGAALFAYPYGESNPYLVGEYFPRNGESLGIKAAFTAQPAFLESGTNRWEIPRFVCGRDWSSPDGLAILLEAASSGHGAGAVPSATERPRPASALRSFASFLVARVRPIPGWLHDEAALLSAHLVRAQRQMRIAGPTLEIGVYEGKYLSVLYELSQPDEPVVGVDLFVGALDKQPAAAKVRSHIAAACGENARLRVVIEDSLQLTSERLSREIGSPGARFISIDGGHTRELVLHDLEAACPLLLPGGILALDDAFNHATPGVIEAIAEYFVTRSPRLAPFALCYNKMFVTTPDYHARYLRHAADFLDEADWLPTSARTRTSRAQNAAFGFVPSMFGHEVVAFV